MLETEQLKAIHFHSMFFHCMESQLCGYCLLFGYKHSNYLCLYKRVIQEYCVLIRNMQLFVLQ